MEEVAVGAPHEEVVDAETSAARLAEIAVSNPELRPWIVAHPNCYDGLREWIETVAAGAPAAQSGLLPDAAPMALQPRLTRKKLLAICGVIGGTIGVLSIAIPLIANFGMRSSSSDTLAIAGADTKVRYEIVGEVWTSPGQSAVNPNRKHWWIPVDAPFETFPEQFDLLKPLTQCSGAQREWLEKYALKRAGTPAFQLRVHNEANVGGSLGLSNIRFEGAEVKSVAIVHMLCNHGGEGGGGLPQPMYIGVDGKEAVYGETVGVTGDVQPEGSPVTINVAPGAVASVTLTRAKDVDRQRNYAGRFLADVVGEDGRTVTLADDVEFRRDQVPGYRIDFVEETGGLLCMTADFSSYEKQWDVYRKWNSEPCTLAQVKAFLGKAAKSVEH